MKLITSFKMLKPDKNYWIKDLAANEVHNCTYKENPNDKTIRLFIGNKITIPYDKIGLDRYIVIGPIPEINVPNFDEYIKQHELELRNKRKYIPDVTNITQAKLDRLQVMWEHEFVSEIIEKSLETLRLTVTASVNEVLKKIPFSITQSTIETNYTVLNIYVNILRDQLIMLYKHGISFTEISIQDLRTNNFSKFNNLFVVTINNKVGDISVNITFSNYVNEILTNEDAHFRMKINPPYSPMNVYKKAQLDKFNHK